MVIVDGVGEGGVAGSAHGSFEDDAELVGVRLHELLRGWVLVLVVGLPLPTARLRCWCRDW